MAVIEFQKRGLPHAHILITLQSDDKPRTAADADKFISAELPDPEQDRVLYDLVVKHMIHGPCGLQSPNSPCMRDGQCSKHFPKAFQPETVINPDGYPMYRRRVSQTTSTNVKLKLYFS